MATKKDLAVAFALAVSTVQADNCANVSPGWMVKAAHASTYCSSVDSGCTGGTPALCPCGMTCCEPVADTCRWAEAGGSTCDSTHFADNTKNSNAVLTDKSDYKTQCCSVKAACSAHTCSSGTTDKTDKATRKCRDATCSNIECCNTDYSGTCLSASGTCSADSYKDSSKYTAASTDFQANCCTAKKTCDATCPAGMKTKSDYSTIKCASGTCSSSECCDSEPLQCLHKSMSGQSCDTNYFVNPATHGSTVNADNSDFKTVCCVAKTTCTQFRDKVNVLANTAGGAIMPKTHAMAILLVAGLIVFGK